MSKTIQQLQSLGFHGSYRPEDITFLLKQNVIQPTDVTQKERLIQSGEAHYSQMISVEKAPSATHLTHYDAAFRLGADRMAQEIQQLGNRLMLHFPQKPIILISLVRAGVPIGVLLKHHIQQHQPCFHYGISIIRDRGIDHAALNAIIQTHGAENIVFVDGWTGKWAIGQELTHTLRDYPALFDAGWSIPRLVTLADLAGCSWLSASTEDWLIPSGILGSVISGLISRSILFEPITEEYAKQNCFNVDAWHSCIFYDNLIAHDVSVDFIEKIRHKMQLNPTTLSAEWQQNHAEQQQIFCQNTIQHLCEKYNIQNINRIKPSIAEATRAVLRRVPDRILLRDDQDENVQLLCHFAKANQVPVEVLDTELGPYKAITLIKHVSGKQ